MRDLSEHVAARDIVAVGAGAARCATRRRGREVIVIG